MENPEFDIPLNGLQAGENKFQWHVGKEFFESFENHEISEADLEAVAVVTKSGESTMVDCSLSGCITLPCDRCLEDLRMPVETDFRLDVKFGKKSGVKESIAAGFGQEDAGDNSGQDAGAEFRQTGGVRETVCLADRQPTFNIAQDIYDFTILALPVRKIHSDGGCNPETVKYMSIELAPENETEEGAKEKGSTLPFSALKAMLEKKEKGR